MKTFATDMLFPEAPVLLPDDSFLFVEMGEGRGWVTHISADGTARRTVAKTGRPNGLARDRHGGIWVAETAQRALLKLSMDGQQVVFAQACGDEPFLFLNDLAFAPNGDLYLTDSGIEVEALAPGGVLNPDWRSLPYDGRVYRIDSASAEVELIDRGIQFTNGVAFGPDQHLYVTETLTGNIYRYEWRNGRVRGRRQLFGNVIEHYDPAQLKGPDGMKFGADGRLYVAVFGQGDITVLDREGAVAERIKVEGTHPTNLAFGPRGEKRIYVTEVSTSSVQVHDVPCGGAPLHG